MLEKFDIDYVLLEGHSSIAPQLGASVGLLPTGLRILDQLGCYDEIEKTVGNAHYKACMSLFGGKSWVDPEDKTICQKLEERIGYPQIFIDRQVALQILYNNLKSKERVLTNKRVCRVEHESEGVKVCTKDGSTYTGDFVVGADGVHSAVRKEMWRIADEDGLKVFKFDPLRDLQCESKCIFGISKRPSGLTASPLRLNAFFKDCNYLVISAPEDRTYWFLITETPKAFGKDIPRYTKEDEQALVERHLQDRITDKVTFEDLYANRLQTTLVHPLSAQGANTAIETAAVLTNTLLTAVQAKEPGKSFTEHDIVSIFTEVQAAQFNRAVAAVNQGRMMNSITVKETLRSRMFINYFFPRFGQGMIFKTWVNSTLSGPLINNLPVPARYVSAVGRYADAYSGRWRSLWSLIPMSVGMVAVLLSTVRARELP
ncbi:hypothetical protein AA0113_g4951 [Alternaria arborescens]|uniref:FAD-binding domain-containing protein n=1 Tax=Alternaria arborescens TaxID=156630 RepID=A0A4Q4S9I4_9PLEO|nr:hypothetical protein AA0113_g4951 [Alternaria arborescens]